MPGDVGPQAVKPGATKAKAPPRPAAPQKRAINPGDLICGGCGEGNPPDRNWCRRCGASLKEAEVFHASWWKRVRSKMRRRKKVRAAGERPRSRRRLFGGAGPGLLQSWVTRIIVVAVIILAILTFFGPYKHTLQNRFSSWYHTVANVIHPSYDPVRAVGATASSAEPAHPAIFAVDGAANTSWWTKGNGVGQSLTIQIGRPTDIDKIGFIIGDTDTPAAFDLEARPLLVSLTFNGSGKPYQKSEVLNDTPAFQSFTVSATDVTSITLTIESVAGGQANSDTALAEVELFSLKR
jgi:ribosomal protein L40E